MTPSSTQFNVSGNDMHYFFCSSLVLFFYWLDADQDENFKDAGGTRWTEPRSLNPCVEENH